MATRYREIKKWGNSLVIVLNSADKEDLKLKVGDSIDIEDAVKKTSKKKKNETKL